MMDNTVLTKKEFEIQLYEGIDRETSRVRQLSSELKRIYYQGNRERLLQYQKDYNVENRERVSARCKECYRQTLATETKTHKKERLAKAKQWREENKEHIKEYADEHREENNRKAREYYRDHKDECLLRSAEYRKKYKDKLKLRELRLQKKRITDKKYRESHREILRLRNKIYRLKKAKEKANV